MFVNPVTVIGEDVPVAEIAPGLQVARKLVIALPPLDAGGPKLMIANPLPASAELMTGGPGGTIGAGVTLTLPEAGPEPLTFRAVTEHE